MTDSPPKSAEVSPLRSRLMGWMGNALLLVATLTVLLAAAEVATRLFAKVETPIVTRNPVVGSTYLRNFEEMVYDEESDREVLIRTNGEGFRGPDRPYQAAAGTRRVAVIGDSFIAAVACFEEETLVAQLEQMLQSSHPGVKWEVMNFGLDASSTAQELVLYREVVSQYSPDLVIVGGDVVNLATVWRELVSKVHALTA